LEDLRQIIMQPAIAGLDEPQLLYRAVRAASRSGPLDDDISMMLVTLD
jgi:hypothetical protein